MPRAAQRLDDFVFEPTEPTPVPQGVSKFSNFYNAFSSPERKWQIEVQNRLLKYAKMQEGWDSYGAPSVGWDTCMFVLNVLNDVMSPRTPVPQVVPSSVGGIQLEWHVKDIDLELHIAAPYQCEVWCQDRRAPAADPLALELTDNFSDLLKPIALLTNR